MAVSKRTRFEVLRRDDYTCRYCRSTDNPLTIDHVVPVALGGTDEPDNLVAACKDCNFGKASATPDQETADQVSADAVRWALAMRKAQALASQRRALDDELFTSWHDDWATYHYADGQQIPYPPSARPTVLSMLKAGLSQVDLREAVAVAMVKKGCDDRFRYFCAVAWNQLRDLQVAARALIDDEWMDVN